MDLCSMDRRLFRLLDSSVSHLSPVIISVTQFLDLEW